MLRKVLLVCLLVPLPAYAVFSAAGKKVNYLETGAKLDYTGTGKVVVVATDERPYVLNGKEKPQFVGQIRGGYGNPFQVLNQTGHPLADDVSASIAASLAAGGYSASADVVPKGETADQTIARVAAGSPDRIVLVRMREMKSDGYASYAFYADVTVSVHDASGAVLQSIESKVDSTLPKMKFSTKYPEFAANINTAYREALQSWINDPKVREGLGGTPAAPGAAPAVAPSAAPAAESAAEVPAN